MEIKNNFNGIRKIVAPVYLNDTLYAWLLKNNSKAALGGIKIISFSQLAKQANIKRLSDEEQFAIAYKELRNKRELFDSYKEVLIYPAFCEQLFNFYKEIIKYNIDIKELPTSSEDEKDLKAMLELLDTLNFSYRNEEKYLASLNKKDYEIVTDYADDFSSAILVDEWKKAGAKPLDIKKTIINQPELYKGANAYQEVFGIAQYIINNQKDYSPSDIQIGVNSPNYYFLIERVFNYYKIPFYISSSYKPSKMIEKLLRFIKFLSEGSKENFYALFSGNSFVVPCKTMATYMNYFDIQPQECLNPFNHLDSVTSQFIDNRQFADIHELEKNAEVQRTELIEPIKELLSEGQIKEKIIYFYNYLLQDDLLKKNKQEKKTFLLARELIANSLNHEYVLSNLEYQLSNLKLQEERPESEAVIINRIPSLLPFKKVTIILDASQKDFFPSPDKNGVVNESYLAKVKNYPTLETRINYNTKIFQQIIAQSEKTIISYSYSSLTGTSQEVSSLIENIIVKEKGNRFIEWPIDGANNSLMEEPKISSDTAKKLFAKDNHINGSVSSLELFKKCPFAYFLQNGLKINTIIGYQEIDVAVLGSLRHKVMQDTIVNGFKADKTVLEKEIAEAFQDLINVYPNKKAQLKVIAQQITDHLFLKIKQAEEMDKGSIYSHAYNELKLNSEIKVDPYPIMMKGIIDRIDVSNDYYRIIDYKSSPHDFQRSSFEAGESLQMITYALLCENEFKEKQPIGVYYFMLSSNKIEREDATVLDLPQNKWEAYLENNKLCGLHFDPPSGDDFVQEKFIKVKRKKKDEDTKYSTMKEILLNNYATISSEITNGNISVIPSDKNCRFCQFDSICHRLKSSEEEGENDGE